MQGTLKPLPNNTWLCNTVRGTLADTRPRLFETAVKEHLSSSGIAAWDLQSIKRTARAVATKTGERWNVWYQSNGARVNEFKAIPSRK